MASRKRIDSIIEQDAIQKEIDFLKGNLTELTETIKKFPAIKTKMEGADNLKELTKAQAQYAEGVKAVNSLINQRFASEAKLVTLQTDYAKATAANRVEQQKLNAELKAQAQADQAAIGSRERAKAQIKLLTQEKDKLNLVNKEEAKQYEILVAKIEKYEAFLKKTGTTAEKQRANVGNYQGSAQIIVDALEKEKKKLEELEATRIRVQNAGANPLTPAASGSPNIGRTTVTGFAGSVSSAKNELTGLDKQIEETRQRIEGFTRVTDQKSFLNLSGKVGDANAELRALTKSLIDLERNGLGDTEGAKKLRTELAELKDQISDTKEEIKALSSDTRKFDLFAGSVTFLADSFQTAVGAAQLFGASEEDAAEATKTLVAIQAVANGVKGIANELTTRGTAANKLYAYAQQQVTIATDASAAASARFAAASRLLLGIGIIAIIGYLVTNYKDLAEQLGITNKSQEALNETYKDFQEGAKTAAENVLKVKSAFQQAKEGVISKDAALKTYNETLGDAFGKTNSLAEAERLYNEKAEVYIKIMGLKAQANALFAKSADETSKQLVATTEDQTSGFDKLLAGAKEYFVKGSSIPGIIEAQAEGEKKAIKESKEREKLFFDEATNKAKEAAELMKQFGITDPTDTKKSSGKDKVAKTKKELDDEFEVRKNHLTRMVAQFSEEADNEKNSYQERLQYLSDWVQASEALTNLLADKQKEGASQKEIRVIEDKAFSDREDAYRSFYGRLRKLIDENIAAGNNDFQVMMGSTYQNVKKISEDIEALMAKEKANQEKKDADYAAKKKQLYKQLYKEIEATIFSFIDDSLQREDDALSRKQTLLDRETEARKNAINASGLSEVERTKQIAAVEKQAAFDRERIEERRRQIAIQRAKFEKAQSIATIIQSTAEAVINALGSKPYTPANLALATITGAIGAAQLARAIATPLPAYRTGTDNAKKGMALVSEEGQELMIDRAGKVKLTPAQPSLVELAGGEKIFPADVTKDILNIIHMRHLIGLRNFADIPMSEQRINQHLQEQMLGELKELNTKSRIIINNQMGIETSAYYLNNMKN